MLRVFAGSTDVTQYLQAKSYSEDWANNNRRNTANFVMNQNKIDYGEAVYIYDALVITKQSNSGTAVLYVEDTFEDCNLFRAGDEIVIQAKSGAEYKRIISSIDHSARTVTLTSNLSTNVVPADVCGRLRFAGVCMKAPEEEIGLTGTFGYKVSLSDWSAAFDRKAVADTYEDQWGREITGRIVYSFTANDTEVTVDAFESAWTEAGVGLAMANETVDRIQGTNAQETGTSGAGTATWSKAPSSIDISAYTHLRFWWKVAEDEGSKIDAMKIRVGEDASNYYEYDIPRIGSLYEDCWNYESVELNNPDATVGSPNLASVDYIAIVLTVTGAIPTGSLLFDHMLATTGGFTLKNTQRGISKFSDERANYQKPTVFVEKLMKQQVMLWYIDVEKDIHEFSSTDTEAPFSLTDTSENYDRLIVTPDITKLVNRVLVRGGEAPAESLLTDIQEADGVQTNFRLAYKPKTLTVEVDTGSGYVSKTIGVENLVDESLYDFVYSFQEKNVRNASHATLASGNKIKFTYYPYQPIRKRVTDPVSIAAMKAIVGGDGIFDGMPIVDYTIRTFEDAQLRGLAELELYSNPLLTATFTTHVEGLRAGQFIRITDSSRGIDQDFLIQQVKGKQKTLDRMEFDVTAGTSLYGIVEMLQYLLKKSSDISNDTNEIVDIVVNIDETIDIEDAYTFTQKSKTTTAGNKFIKRFDFIAELGSRTSDGLITSAGSALNTTTAFRSKWYAEFIGSETGTVQFTSGNYNTGRELRITTGVGGTGKEAKARLVDRMPASAGTLYSISLYAQILAALTNQGTGAGLKVTVKEYSSTGALLVTNTIVTGQTDIQDYTRYSGSFTTNASTASLSIEVSLVAAIGTVAVSDILITESTAEAQANPSIASYSEAV